MPLPRLLLTVLLGMATVLGAPAQEPSERARLETLVARAHAERVHAQYAACVEKARALDRAARAFVKTPSPERLEAARVAWIAGRRIYGRTEVHRFYDGPIDNARDGVEIQVNAWPLDEAYIDAVVGRPDGGIIQDPERFPNLNGTVLTLANERGGEKNVSLGWHAIEFLLWGQDLDPDGPGARPHTDFVPGETPHAERRGAYLLAVTEQLVRHLEQVERRWRDTEESYRRVFVATPRESVGKILRGMVLLSGFEMAGERLAVAYETRDQEEEHSCFSDTTHIDFIANQEGIRRVWEGRGDEAPGLVHLARQAAPELAADLDRKLDAATRAIAAIPVPFDRALRGPDDGPERAALLAALVALEQQAETLSALGLLLGYEVPLDPGG